MIAQVETRHYKTVEEFLQEYHPNHALITEHLTYEEVLDIVVSALSKAEGKYLYKIDTLDHTITVEKLQQEEKIVFELRDNVDNDLFYTGTKSQALFDLLQQWIDDGVFYDEEEYIEEKGKKLNLDDYKNLNVESDEFQELFRMFAVKYYYLFTIKC